ncbi:ATP-sensitive inward rectifier potassium channel 11-like [Pomacea canaliculata]|uniref:ATP-sensitive inward rectifier potassium channel 11-like n=1 Tax=Pomacea canaliculata TaxID=400727 RepID=UPI000D730E8B|nr:ATP-sensitive inward rectifier potassium channel 11-like [Pomacea canaliculata]
MESQVTTAERQEELGQTLFLFAEPVSTPKRSQWRRLWVNLREHVRRRCQKDDPEVKRKAAVAKNGNYRIHNSGLSEHRRRFLADIYITMIDLPWRYAIAILFNAFLFSFLIFAILWWLIGHSNGDFENFGNPNHTACLKGVQGFAGSLLFSIETQTTIGYGFAYPRAECAGTLPLLYIQVVIGFMLETLMLGFIFVKVARPKYRAQTILFSKRAVVCLENGVPCLQVRVGDLRKSHLLDASMTAMVIRRHSAPEGAFYPLYQHKVEFEAHGMGSRIVLMWPIILTHRLTPDSPLYDMRPADLMSERMELVLFLTGTVEATGEICQARTSYTPQEVMWGHRFERMEEYDMTHARWHVDFASFDDVVYCQNLRHSARELAELKAARPEITAKPEEEEAEATKGSKGAREKLKALPVSRDIAVSESYQRALRLFRHERN